MSFWGICTGAFVLAIGTIGAFGLYPALARRGRGVRFGASSAAAALAVLLAFSAATAVSWMRRPEIARELPDTAIVEATSLQDGFVSWFLRPTSDSRVRARMSRTEFDAYARALHAPCVASEASGRIECHRAYMPERSAPSTCYEHVPEGSDPIAPDWSVRIDSSCWGEHCFIHVHWDPSGVAEARQYCSDVMG